MLSNVWGWTKAVLIVAASATSIGACAETPSMPEAQPRVLWKYRQSGGAMSVPYADDEVAVFNTISGQRVVALGARTGKKLWEQRLPIPPEIRLGTFPPSRLIGAGDLVVVPAWDLYALDKKTGLTRWTLSPPDDFPGAGVSLGEDGHIYSTGRYLYRIAPATGVVLWRVSLGEQPFDPVERDGVVYVGTRDTIPGSSGVLGAGHAVALEAATGRVLWRTHIPAPNDRALGGPTGAGAITPELYIVSSPSSRVYALDRRTGQIVWESKGTGPYRAGVAVIGDVAVTAGDPGVVDAFDLATGTPRWSVKLMGNVTSPLAIHGNKVLAVNGRLWAVSATGRVVWRHDAGETVPYSTGAHVHGGTAFVGTSAGKDVGFFAVNIGN